MATIKDLIGLGPDELAKMTDEELRRHCEPYLRIVVAKVEEQGEVDLDESVEGVGSPSFKPAKPKRAKSSNPKTKEELMEEMRKLAALHGVNIEQPTRIK